MNVLVPGGCGFIGSAMVRTLLKDRTTATVVIPDLPACRDNQARTENAPQDVYARERLGEFEVQRP